MIEYDVQQWFGVAVILQMTGSVFPQALLPSCVSILVAALVLAERGDPFAKDMDDVASGDSTDADPPLQIFRQFLRHPYPHQITSVMIGFMMVFRVQLSYNRYWEGIGRLTDMFTKWYDAAVQVCAFDELSTGEAAAVGPAFRTHAIHLFSLMSTCSILELKRESLDILSREPNPSHHNGRHSSSNNAAAAFLSRHVLPVLGRIIGKEPPEPDYGGRDKIAVVGGFLEGELAHLEGHSPHYVDCAISRLVRLISVRCKEGGVAMPAPIVSRIYQELSNGALGFHQAQKIARVPFPFPYAQLLAIMKVYFILTVPMAVVSFTNNTGFAVFMSFFTSFIFVCLNEVAIELEDPFGNDANDLPLRNMHKSFNKALEHLLHQEAPEMDNIKSMHTMKLQSGIRSITGRLRNAGAPPGSSPLAPTTETPQALTQQPLARANTAPLSPPSGGSNAALSSSTGAPPPPSPSQQEVDEGAARLLAVLAKPKKSNPLLAAVKAMKEEEESCEGGSTSSAPATPDARLQQPAAAAPRPAAATMPGSQAVDDVMSTPPRQIAAAAEADPNDPACRV